MMSIIFLFAAYISIGSSLVQTALYISQYNIEQGADKWRTIGIAIVCWPLFLIIMLGYWGWIGYHSTKHWIKSY